mmetsp:Transcript_36011/g.84428  ORF Transcript_36011/g.84428 Transcript_36011/m.84428 type:complete len:546 (+) Transcript_36011:161-1798(+)
MLRILFPVASLLRFASIGANAQSWPDIAQQEQALSISKVVGESTYHTSPAYESEVSEDVRRFAKLDAKHPLSASAAGSSSDEGPSEVQVLRQEVKDLRSRIGSLQDDKVELVRAVQGVMRTNQTAVLEGRLQRMADAKSGEEAHWSQEEERWQAERSKLQEQLQRAAANYTDLQDDSKDLARLTGDLQRRNQMLQSQIEQMQKQMQALQSDKHDLIRTVDQVMQGKAAPLKSVSTSASQAEESKSHWESDAFALSSQLAGLKLKMKKMAEQDTALTSANAALRQQVGRLSTEAAAVEATASPLPPGQNLVHLKDQQLRSVAEQNLMLQAQKDQLASETSKMQIEVRQLTEDKAHLMSTVRSLMHDNDEQKRAYQAEAARLQADIEKLEQQKAAAVAAEKRERASMQGHRGSAGNRRLLAAHKPELATAPHRRPTPVTTRLRHSKRKEAVVANPPWRGPLSMDDSVADMGDAVALEHFVHEARMKRLLDEADAPQESVPHTTPVVAVEAVPQQEEADVNTESEELSQDVGKLLRSAKGVLKDEDMQ